MFPPVDPTRRRFLTVAAGASVASVGTLAVAAPDSPACAVDPIYAVIERHRTACEAHTQAVHVKCDFEEVGMTGEKRRQYEILDALSDAAYDHMEEVGGELVNTKPTTLAGIAALCRYVEPFFNEHETMNLPEAICWDDETESSAAGAFANVIAAAIEALIKIQAGQAVRS
jgi:hypothetical protein